MKGKLKEVLGMILALALTLLSTAVFAAEEQSPRFSDVPEDHWAYKAVHDLRQLKITDGIGNNKFGMGIVIKRSEFVAYLVRLMGWELIKPEAGSFIDNMDATKWYYPYIETALRNNVISGSSDRFRPEEPITREDMAVMIVNALGYDTLAQQLNYSGSDFEDVTSNTGYITIAKDFGIITGVGGNRFNPAANAKREEAAAMMMRMYERLNTSISELHAFYAIRSYPQIDMVASLDSVSFGWSRLEYDAQTGQVVLNMTDNNGNDFHVPAGFSEPIGLAQENGVSTQLMVFADNNTLVYPEGDIKLPLLEYILTRPEPRKQAVASIIQKVNATTGEGVTISFDGVVVDFESMKGEVLKEAFNVFLKELKQELDGTSKKLYVTVHPKRKPGQEYYDGYDYKTIGEIADRVILMAHDYYAKKLTDSEMQSGYTFTPLTPIDEVYYALKAISDKSSGIVDLSKVWLQISFDAVQWKLKDGKVTRQNPFKPAYNAIQQRLLTDAEMNFSNLSRNPYATFFDNSDGTSNVLWYEDSRSVQAKIRLARMFGINGISLWRLGNIPDYRDTDEKRLYLDVWQDILSERKK